MPPELWVSDQSTSSLALPHNAGTEFCCLFGENTLTSTLKVDLGICSDISAKLLSSQFVLGTAEWRRSSGSYP